jgi:hypothetical protein
MLISSTVKLPRNFLTVKTATGVLSRLKFYVKSRNTRTQTFPTWRKMFCFSNSPKKAVSLYEKQEMKEKRRILDFLFSNCLWKGGSLVPNYRKPFDTLALTNAAYQCERRSSSNGPVFCWCVFQSASFGRKIAFHAATTQCSRHYRKISMVAAAPISAARTSIFLALCLVAGRALRGRCRSNQSRPPATCR